MSLTNALKRLERDGKLTPSGSGSVETTGGVPADPNVRSEQQVLDLIDRAEASLDAALAGELPAESTQAPSAPAAPPASLAPQAASGPLAEPHIERLAAVAPQHDRDQRVWDDVDDSDEDEPSDFTDGLATLPLPPAIIPPNATAAPTPEIRSSQTPAAAPTEPLRAGNELLDAESGVLSSWAELARLVQEAGAYDPPIGPLGGTFAASSYAPVILPIDDLLYADDDDEVAKDKPSRDNVTRDYAREQMAEATTQFYENHSQEADATEDVEEDAAADVLSMNRLDELERLAREYAQPSGSNDHHASAPRPHAAEGLIMEADMDAIFRSLGVVASPVSRMDDELDAMLANGPPAAARPVQPTPVSPVPVSPAPVSPVAVSPVAVSPTAVSPVAGEMDTETHADLKEHANEHAIEDAEADVLSLPTAASANQALAPEAALDQVFYDSGLHDDRPLVLQAPLAITDFERRIAASLRSPSVQQEMERIADRLRGCLRGDLPETMGCVAPRATGRTADVLAQMALWLGPLDEDVLVVDANLADQSLTRGLRALDEPGLCEVLSRERTAWEAVRPTSQPHLWIVPTGDDIHGLSRIPHQADLNQLRELLQFWKTYFHRVFIDLGTVHSTLVEPFAQTLDATILVLPASRDSLRDARDAADQMRSFGSPPVGCILTDTRAM